MTTTTTTRPAWYDAELLSHAHLIQKLARHRVPHADVEELVADINLAALNRWALYDRAFKFGTWLGLVRDFVMTERSRKTRRIKRSGTMVPLDGIEIAIAPEQESAVDLHRMITAIPGGRDGDILVRAVMGDEFVDIGRSYGFSRQRAAQLAGRAAECVRAQLGVAV